MDKPKKINEIIQFQEGSVVSREIINKPTGTVTLFAFDKGQGLSEHTTPFDALVLITEGVAEITIAGNRYETKAGEMILLPANESHSLKANQPFKMILTMIKSSDLK